ncbi:hypothetical protein IKQ21_02505 [bacterium]|nr:hypothetical protein [bacterium]
MTITLSDLYNAAASQEWSMYDGDVTEKGDMEQSLVIAINKAVTEILYSYPFKFRERTHVLFTLPCTDSYEMPYGLIMKDESDRYLVKLNSKFLKLIEKPNELDVRRGVPEGFYVKGSEIVLYPIPSEKFILTVDYMTLAIGEDKDGEEIFVLKDAEDRLIVPEYLEEIFKQAVISRTLLKTISAEGDENYGAYKKQSEISYRQLVKYSKGIIKDKEIRL